MKKVFLPLLFALRALLLPPTFMLAKETFSTPEELEPYVRATKARYVADGWQDVENAREG
jgi:hypothetical protein